MGVRYFGAAEEVTFGTKITDDNSFNYIDASEVGLDTPKDSILSYTGITRRSPQVVSKGAYIPEGDMSQAMEGIFVGWLLKWVLGTYRDCLQFDGGKEAYRHTFRSGSTIKSFTARLGKEQMEQIFEGCKIGSCSIEIPTGDFAMMTASIVAQQDSKGTLKAEADIDPSDSGFFSFCHGGLSIGGPTVVCNSIGLEINNNISAEAGLRVGSRFPQQFAINALEMPITIELPYDDTTANTHVTNFWGNANTPTTLTSKAVVISLTSDDTLIDGTNYYAMTFTFPCCYYKSIGQPVKGRDEMVQSLELMAMHDLTEEYAIQVTLDTSFFAYALECFFRCIYARSTTLVFAGGTRGKIHKTSDGGATAWSELTTGLTTYASRINRIEFVSDTTGYAVGMDGKVLKTTDATAWVDVSPTITTDWYGLFVVDATTLYVCGAGGVIYYTANSGTTWAAKTSGVTTDLYAITGISDEYICCGAAGVILNSPDGTTWTARTSGVAVDLLACTAFEGTPDIWICCGENGTVVTSADAETWADKSIAGVTAELRGVDCTSATVAVVVGDNNTIQYTANSGTAWTVKDDGLTADEIINYYGVTMASATAWYISGTFEKIMKTSDTGTTWATMIV